LLDAAREHNILLDHSYMIGDRASDVAAGLAAGCRTIFIDLGYSEPKPRDATFIVRSIREAADVVLDTKQN
jgi:D-glycero-D-manno-heptose 1,7-bisphosphate phosphatase